MRTVMLVDDERHIVDALTRHIAWDRLGLCISASAGDGIEALRLYRERKPDLVITDINMPGMSGLQLVEELRAESPELPIVILSGFDEFEHARQAMRWGVHHFLLKPASVPEIEGVLTELLEELELQREKQQLEEHYKQEHDRLLPYLREKLFIELLTTRYAETELSEERLAYLAIDLPQLTAAISLRMTRSALLAKPGERDWQLLKFGADNIIREMLAGQTLPEGVRSYAVNYSDSLFVLLLLDSGQQADTSAADRLYAIGEQAALAITEKMTALLKIEAVAGLGSVRGGLHELIDSYLESRSALEAAEFEGASRVYPYREWAELETAFDRYGPLLKQWNGALAGKEPDKAAESWQSIYSYLLQEANGSLTDVQTICVSLFSSLIMYWNDEFPELPPPWPMSRFLQDIQRQLTRNELTGWMDGLVREWQQLIVQELSGRRSNKLVDCVKQYVEAHYSREISFAAIAKELYVHPKYLSQLFKRVTGENFVHHLNRFRIQKAIHYLQSGQHMVYEVSEMVGFNNPTYFSQVFKMMTGKSPSDYFKI